MQHWKSRPDRGSRYPLERRLAANGPPPILLPAEAFAARAPLQRKPEAFAARAPLQRKPGGFAARRRSNGNRGDLRRAGKPVPVGAAPSPRMAAVQYSCRRRHSRRGAAPTKTGGIRGEGAAPTKTGGIRGEAPLQRKSGGFAQSWEAGTRRSGALAANGRRPILLPAEAFAARRRSNENRRHSRRGRRSNGSRGRCCASNATTP